MDKIHAMQLFIRVADLESFSRAAETLALPKGSVSRQIQALESHLGVRLLHRTPAGSSSPRMGWSTTSGRKIC
ncbi:LysR family transcriptional regulator YhjC [Klebsiella pneumoniae]|uniref:LysR family transcriptional regulator YhjC n=1 Tax=Klebsiella pneumoniae TaxID=573 RepID=A0A377U2D3_KLEPN|nr:LysR family transcriptional regulator YhjC [Klebsiella pneumoniae]